MNAIQDIKDEEIRKIAQTLRTSGLASSESEAVRMAVMMSKTSQRVTQNFEQKRESSTMGLTHLHKEAPVEVSKKTSFFNQATSSVQEKPKKIEEKEEFIFGDSQEPQKPVQRKDAFEVDKDFEEEISQDIISTKPLQQKPVHAFAPSKVTFSAPAHAEPIVAAKMPEQVRAQQSAPMSAAASAQSAFSILLGSAQKNPVYDEEVKKHTPAPVVAPVVHSAPTQVPPSIQAKPVNVAPISQPASISPQKKMMMESNVDLSKMFNFNK
ncbi:MAG: hypothetical protein WC758_05085 [Candidatus Woesearchaeota archaeon]|jgi:hypothetical protein